MDKALDIEDIKAQLTELRKTTDVTSIAVVLMHAYAVPDHELQVGKIAS